MVNSNLNRFVIGLISLLFISACGQQTQSISKLEGQAQGTTYHISYWSETPVESKAIEQGVLTAFADIDKTLSNYRPDSVIEIFNANPSTDSQWVGKEIVSLVELAGQVSRVSQGCYDLTIKPLFDLWGFKGDSLTIPEPGVLADTLATVGLDKVKVVDDEHLQKPAHVRVDVSSITQGYSVKSISRELEQQGVRHYLVEIGGELKTHGHKPDGSAWRIAVEKPLPG